MICGLIRNKKHNKEYRDNLCLKFQDVLNIPDAFNLCDEYDYITNNYSIQHNRDCASFSVLKYVSQHQKIDNKLSVLYLYYNSRKIQDGEKNICDIGASLENTIKGLIDYGYINDDLHPYDSNVNQKPSDICYEQAIKIYKSFKYVKHNLLQFKYILSVKKQPIVFGMDIYSNYSELNINNGDILYPPDKNKHVMIGSHGLILLGFNDETKTFIVSNSWFSKFHKISYKYILSKLCFDFMIIQE